jgi:hypothetical protein
MIKIRKGVFETNSSSSHSIAIKKEDKYCTPDTLGKFCIWDGELKLWGSELEFGRSPFEVLATFYDKARYAIASFGRYDEEHRKEVEDLMHEIMPGLKTIEYGSTLDWGTEEEVPDFGYVDHQSCGVLKEFLDRNNISLKEFLTNDKYVVFIDGDEYRVKEYLFEHGLLHKEDFEDIG